MPGNLCKKHTKRGVQYPSNFLIAFRYGKQQIRNWNGQARPIQYALQIQIENYSLHWYH